MSERTPAAVWLTRILAPARPMAYIQMYDTARPPRVHKKIEEDGVVFFW